MYVEDPLHSGNVLDKNAWEHAYEIAGGIINNELSDPTFGANHYYDDSINTPSWAVAKTPTSVVSYTNEYQKNVSIFFFKL
ncbi:hypothetical protein A2W32_00835 [candidate division WWE3 bacterium RBG_16_37_10]|uniref:Cell wall hydrolase SleB domain-containing protein n=1 Tax=candidate division WWE3 bacterium RBG_16_37_10 TaxID=1802610 RepID=A0A1F4V228_UNCKA|nr:MAG: hypothetical protein A2W32_00835 [candidate division WWE3 bacterium RBG_16_37_10]